MQKPEAIYKNLAIDVLKELRKERGVTQRELASLLKLSQTRIAHLESGRDILNEETKNKVLFALKISPAEFQLRFKEKQNGFSSFDLLILKLQNLPRHKLKLIEELVDCL